MTRRSRDMVWVVLPTSGVRAVGEYLQGVPYQVSAAEAARLIEVKGFIETTPPADAPLAQPEG